MHTVSEAESVGRSQNIRNPIAGRGPKEGLKGHRWGKAVRRIGFFPRRVFKWIVLGAVGLATAFASGATVPDATPTTTPPQTKNVILMIADGAGIEAYTLARWLKGEALAVDSMEVALVKTHSTDSVITDSAPAASAYATGVRTSGAFLSVGPHPKVLSTLPPVPEDLPYRPLATVLEGAKLLGKATGIVVTCRVTHATPAALMAHTPHRDDEQNIMLQIVHQQVDVVLGGGRDFILPTSAGGKRTDGRDLTPILKTRGYQMPQTRQQLAGISTGKVFGLFAMGHLAAEIDRPESAPDEPSLEEMTRKAIDLLKQDPEGFFLMVEGSQIDWACHANDPAHLAHEILMFDRAVGVAHEFARQDGQTLLVVVSDHATGGLSIGNTGPLSKGSLTVEALVEPIRRMKCSAPVLWKKLGSNPTPERVQEVLRENWGLEIPLQEAADLLAEAKRNPKNPQNAFTLISTRYTALGWTTHNHTGGDVPLFTLGPGKPKGVLASPQVGQCIAEALGMDFQKLNGRLFVEPSKALPEVKIQLLPEGASTPQIVRLQYGQSRVDLPVQENLLKQEDRSVELEGLCIYARQTKRVYVPWQALQILTGNREPLPAIRKGS